MYILKDKVMFQKDYRIKENETVAEFVARYEGDDLDPAAAIAVVAVDGKPFELNMSAAIILESLILGKSCDEIAELLISLFGIEKDVAECAVSQMLMDFIEKNIVKIAAK